MTTSQQPTAATLPTLSSKSIRLSRATIDGRYHGNRSQLMLMVSSTEAYTGDVTGRRERTVRLAIEVPAELEAQVMTLTRRQTVSLEVGAASEITGDLEADARTLLRSIRLLD